MFASRQLVSRIIQQKVRRYHSEHFKPPTMDELPVPAGSWAEMNAKRQKKYNATLIAGIGFAMFTFVVAKSSGLVYLNYYPPKSID